jgi:exopolysaccharide biosynthesis polyprenyl glycosylphosphotransferase
VSFRTCPIWPEIGRILKALLSVAVVQAAAIYFLRMHVDVSRPFFAAYFATALLLLAGDRILLRGAVHRARRGGLNSRVFAVVGSGDLANDVVSTVADHPEWGLVFAGNIVEEGAVLAPENLLGSVSQIGQILDDNVIDEVIFAVPRDRHAEVQEAFRDCQARGADARVCLDLFELDGARAVLGDLDGLPMLSFSRAPSDGVALLLKRAFDVVSSAAALVLFSPVILATAIAVKLESPGPVFFRQVRVGKNGRPFRMFKFRSMRVDAEDRLEALRLQNEASGPVFKMRNDPRVTRVGGFIRRYSIDELPQFLNVLSGEMSVVGPRPPVPAEVRQYERWQRRRLSVKPGITCTWQVSGRSDVSFDRWMELDLAYIDSWSLWQDVRICFETIPAVLTSRGAR